MYPDEEIKEEENGKLVDFPGDEVMMPPQRLPENLGRVDDDHALRKPILVLIIILGVFLAGVLVYTFAGGTLPGQKSPGANESSIVDTYREAGSITYQDKIINGWFLDTERQHFMDNKGVRYTYVDPHEREGHRVTGYWRILE